jgi:multisubunit Na+/H+ antiporter MnhC subunit
VLGLLKYIVGIPVSYYVSNHFSDAVYTGFVREPVRNYIAKQLEKSADVDGYIASLKESVATMPEIFRSKLDMSALDGASTKSMVDFIEAKIAAPIAGALIHTLLFVITFAVVSAIVALLVAVFRHSDKKDKDKEDGGSALKTGNRLLGGALGLVKALVFILVVATVAAYALELVPADSDGAFVNSVRNSYVINHFNQINPMV